MKTTNKKIIVIGGGAAGIFAALHAAELGHEVTVVEKSQKLLTKVAISGGGRCNVTHACFDPKELTNAYPRGQKALLGPFHRFQPRDTINWFAERGIELKEEQDGRMFPTTDSSQTIIDCFLGEAKRLGVTILKGWDVIKIEPSFTLTAKTGEQLKCDKVIIATGSAPRIRNELAALGHTIIPPVPSLFTFKVINPWEELAGVSMGKVRASIEGLPYQQEGALVVTHWGFSGPAVLKLSAWAARELHSQEYKGTLCIDWVPEMNVDQIIEEMRLGHGAKKVCSSNPFQLPKSLWRQLTHDLDHPWAHLSKEQLKTMKKRLKRSCFSFDGKSTYKDEFVTAGGVNLEEVHFKNMESKCCPGIHFAGEALDIDAITGGYNFQNAWTTAWLAASD